MQPRISSIEEKLDAILKSLDVLKQEHKDGQQEFWWKIEKLKKHVNSRQEEAPKGGQNISILGKKGNKRQFLFNENVKDQIKAARKWLDLLEPSILGGQKESLDRAKEELQKGLVL